MQRPEPVPSWQLLYRALPRRASRTTLLVLGLSALVVLGLQWRAHRRGPALVTLSVFATLLETSPLFNARPTALRLFYVAFFFYYFHINLIFRTAITSDLTQRPYQVTFHRLQR